MKRIMKMQTHLTRFAAVALAALLAACAPHTLQINIDPVATETASAAIPQFTSAPAESSPAATAALPPAGVGWLMVDTEQGLWMSRPDGSQAGIRIPGTILVPVPIADALSPAGDLFAYITYAYGQGAYSNPVLNIASLTGREPAFVLPLTTPETARTDIFFDNIHDAMTAYSPYAWSPEGGRLAFIGAHEGTSADLYEYYRESGEVVRLTDGPDQAYRPVWSPDGVWIVHGAAGSFGSGAGFGMAGFYAARADGGGVISLYDIGERSGDEVGVGWLDSNTLVANTWRQPCGPSDLRLVDLSAQKADLVFEGCLSGVAVGPGVVLFAQSSDTIRMDENPRPGMYLLTASDRSPRLISSVNLYEIAWEKDIGAFLALTKDNRLLEVSPAGEIRGLPGTAPRLPAVSPDGRYWAYIAYDADFYGEAIFAGEYGREPARIFEGQVAMNGMLFSPAGDALYFITGHGELFRLQAPDWSPALLASGIPISDDRFNRVNMAWWEGE
jgi:hypothetical protein